MTSYFQWAEQRTRRPAPRTEHGTEIVDIPSIMVTEHGDTDPRNDRHGWTCPCVMCRSDRGEE